MRYLLRVRTNNVIPTLDKVTKESNYGKRGRERKGEKKSVDFGVGQFKMHEKRAKE